MLNLLILILMGLLTACSPQNNSQTTHQQSGTSPSTPPFVIGAIPDQDPEKLQRLYGDLAAYLSEKLGVPVEYKPVTDYTAAVTAFRVGDLDMVWFGGLTGVQARLQVPGAQALVQRDIDAEFHSIFIANTSTGLQPIADTDEWDVVREKLGALKGHTFTFGSESSTSGRLMPQYFLSQAGIELTDFKGEPGFSGSHDKTIELVTAGAYDAGVLNEQVWYSRLQTGDVDLAKVQAIWRTPAYHDYHWVIHPDVITRYGTDFPQKVTDAFTALNAADSTQAKILDMFGATQFIPTTNANYDHIEAVGRQIGKIVD